MKNILIYSALFSLLLGYNSALACDKHIAGHHETKTEEKSHEHYNDKSSEHKEHKEHKEEKK